VKAISLWQPWASLWLTDRKPDETRHWQTSHRGWLAVHAAKKFVRDIPPGDPLREILDDEFGGHWAMDLPSGAILGAVHLLDCLSMRTVAPLHEDDRVCGDWSAERFAWRRGAVVKLKTPIPFKGRQGIFTLPDDIAAVILPSQAVQS
jgi:hypothetical protein